jgi:hypothetical protein
MRGIGSGGRDSALLHPAFLHNHMHSTPLYFYFTSLLLHFSSSSLSNNTTLVTKGEPCHLSHPTLFSTIVIAIEIDIDIDIEDAKQETKKQETGKTKQMQNPGSRSQVSFHLISYLLYCHPPSPAPAPSPSATASPS